MKQEMNAYASKILFPCNTLDKNAVRGMRLQCTRLLTFDRNHYTTQIWSDSNRFQCNDNSCTLIYVLYFSFQSTDVKLCPDHASGKIQMQREMPAPTPLHLNTSKQHSVKHAQQTVAMVPHNTVRSLCSSQFLSSQRKFYFCRAILFKTFKYFF